MQFFGSEISQAEHINDCLRRTFSFGIFAILTPRRCDLSGPDRRLEGWLSLVGKANWRGQINCLSGVEHEQVYENVAVEALQAMPGYA
ncbi:MAG: hypothetical protein HEQ34_09830 [Sphingorhabdus sp.]|uniref:hypothetical protein n=1 Tax=Sphingorhabdus sp. TaxID=1902408 RepID=UPI0025E1CF57|nr:hypothetical protein [Sphingorhabdus sp.]MCO4092236.1 hypothetical protein [Sphingorhabdus sp.]